jgi:hypothetical protein
MASYCSCSGTGSASQKVTIPAVPVPIPAPYLDHRKLIFPKFVWKNLAFLHSKLFNKENIYRINFITFIVKCE